MKIITNESRKGSLQRLKALAYGYPGSGKTWFCGSACSSDLTAPVLYVDFRGQSASLGHYPNLDPSRFVHVQLEAYKELSYIYTFLAKGRGYIKALDDLFDKTFENFPKTVCIDSITELQRQQVLEIAGNDTDNTVLPLSFNRPRIQDWATLLNLFVTLGTHHFGLDVNMIFTCLAKNDYNEKDEREFTTVALQGAAADQLPSTAMTVMYMEALPKGATTKQWGTEEPIYNVGHFRMNNKAFARDNTGVFTEDLFNPTIPRMVQLLNGRVQ